jgi:lipopolysaccharide export system protein LptC
MIARPLCNPSPDGKLTLTPKPTSGWMKTAQSSMAAANLSLKKYLVKEEAKAVHTEEDYQYDMDEKVAIHLKDSGDTNDKNYHQLSQKFQKYENSKTISVTPKLVKKELNKANVNNAYFKASTKDIKKCT